MQKLKMYILVKDSLPIGKAAVGIAHASLACYLKFKDNPEVKEWLDGPFYKTICLVNDTEFEKSKELADHIVITESTLDNQETVIAFKPRIEYPKGFGFFRLYK
jgi:peptidyl-tRNA hydrolase